MSKFRDENFHLLQSSKPKIENNVYTMAPIKQPLVENNLPKKKK